MATRRDALATIAAGTATLTFGQTRPEPLPDHKTHETAAEGPTQKFERTPQFFHGRDYEAVTRLADLIIPRTDTPGAVDVNVPWRIDQAVSRKKELQPLFTNGLSWLNEQAKKQGKTDFAALAEENQTALLMDLSERKQGREAEFFQAVKALTIEWYYNSQEGLTQELGFKGNTYRTEFTGCTHPEHWLSEKV